MPRKKIQFETKPEVQKAFLVGVDFRNPAYKATHAQLPLDSSMAELELLCKTAGLAVIGQTTQHLDSPNPNTFIGPGKVEEIVAWRDELAFDVVVFDDELSPRHQRELEEAMGEKVTVLDRTGLILDIFAQHASTREGSLQVELAQYEYRKPRLTRQWTHLARQAGGRAGGSTGGVGVRGPGETQLEVDRRRIDERITKLKRELEEVRKQRAQHRAQRKRSEIPVVAIVGYTNAGKSTLINALSGSSVLAEDKLFATLDPTTRRIVLPSGREILVTDTVGFINNLPTMVIAAFRATLEEISEATVLVHVLDVTHRNAREQAQTVELVLEDLGNDDKPVVLALNKIDQLPEGIVERPSFIAEMKLVSRVAEISGRTGTGIPALMAQIEAALEDEQHFVPVAVTIPYAKSELVDRFHRLGRVEDTQYDERGSTIIGVLPERALTSFSPFVEIRGDGSSRRVVEPQQPETMAR